MLSSESSIRETAEAIIHHLYCDLYLSLFAIFREENPRIFNKHCTTYFELNHIYELNEGIYDCFVLEIQIEQVLKDKFVQPRRGVIK